MAVSFDKLLDENLSTVIMKPGSLVTGIVLDILDNYVIVHVGLKSEAAVPINEFYNESGELKLEIGDEVQLTLEAIEEIFSEKTGPGASPQKNRCLALIFSIFCRFLAPMGGPENSLGAPKNPKKL